MHTIHPLRIEDKKLLHIIGVFNYASEGWGERWAAQRDDVCCDANLNPKTNPITRKPQCNTRGAMWRGTGRDPLAVVRQLRVQRGQACRAEVPLSWNQVGCYNPDRGADVGLELPHRREGVRGKPLRAGVWRLRNSPQWREDAVGV